MKKIKLPDPDTHCWDDDLQPPRDVWSYSADLVRQIVEADRAQQGEPTSLSGQGAVIHGQLVAAVQRLLQSQNEPERFGCVGPSPSEIAYRNLIHLIQHACAGIDSPPSQPERKPHTEKVGNTSSESMVVSFP